MDPEALKAPDAPKTPDTQNAQDGGEQSEQDKARTFTQTDVDRIIADRLRRQKSQYSDYDDLKSQAEKWEEHEQEQKSELEKAQDRADKAEAATAAALQHAQETLIRGAFIAEAAKAGAAHPEDAYSLADRTSVSVDDQGAITGVTEAVTSLIEEKRLVMSGKPAAPSLDGGKGGGTRASDQATKDLTEEELAYARKMGLTPEQYQKHKQ